MRKGFISPLIFVIIIIGLIAVGTITYLQFKTRLALQVLPTPNPNETIPSPTPNFSPQPTSQTTIDKITGWKIYTDNQFGISFSYPPDSELQEESGTPRYINVKKVLGVNEWYRFSVGKIGDTKNISFDKYTQEYYESSNKSTNDKCQGTAQNTALTKTILSRETSYTFQQLNCYDTNTIIFIILKDSNIFYVAVSATGENKEVNLKKANQILSTFQFID